MAGTVLYFVAITAEDTSKRQIQWGEVNIWLHVRHKIRDATSSRSSVRDGVGVSQHLVWFIAPRDGGFKLQIANAV